MIKPIEPTKPNPTNRISFTHKWDVKTLWKKGRLPQIKYGFYGDELTIKNCTVEHLLPLSKGGQTKTYNLVLASAANNQARSNTDLREVIDIDAAQQYLRQFQGIKKRNFNGDSYIHMIKETLKTLGIDLSKKNPIQ